MNNPLIQGVLVAILGTVISVILGCVVVGCMIAYRQYACV